MLVGIYLARVPAYNAEDFLALQKASFAPLLKDLTFRWHAGEVLLDLVLIAVCYYGAYRMRFEGEGLDNFLPYFTASLPVVLGCKLAALYVSGLYSRRGRRSACAISPPSCAASGWDRCCRCSRSRICYRFEGFSRGVFLLDAVLLTVAIVATRASFRAMTWWRPPGASAAGACWSTAPARSDRLLVREMRANPTGA